MKKQDTFESYMKVQQKDNNQARSPTHKASDIVNSKPDKISKDQVHQLKEDLHKEKVNMAGGKYARKEEGKNGTPQSMKKSMKEALQRKAQSMLTAENPKKKNEKLGEIAQK